MIEILLISLLLVSCLAISWAIFHNKKKKGDKSSKKPDKKAEKKEEKPVIKSGEDKKDKSQEDKTEKKKDETTEEKPPEIKDDIKLSKSERKFKITKVAKEAPKETPRIEKVYAGEEQKTEEPQELEMVMVKQPEPQKQSAQVSGEKSIEKVFDESKKEEQEEKQEEKPKQSDKTLPIRTPSIRNRIDFRTHLDDIYNGFSMGIAPPPPPKKIEEKEDKSKKSDDDGSNFLFKFFKDIDMEEMPEKPKKSSIKINTKDMLIADTLMHRPTYLKKFKKNKRI